MKPKAVYAILRPEREDLSFPGLTPGKLYTVHSDNPYSSLFEVRNDEGETSVADKADWFLFDGQMNPIRGGKGAFDGRPFTQKARSIMVCSHINNSFAPGIYPPPQPIYCIPGAGIPNAEQFPLFGRSCPSRPRHGFVDSRKVYGAEDTLALLQLATASDSEENAEVILMPALDGRYSALATNAGVGWGKGNDGVTGGTDQSALHIPAASSSRNWNTALTQSFFVGDHRVKDNIEDTPYLEIVEHQRRAFAVQLRDGPAQQAEENYIPRKTVVKHVLVPVGDLMEWEHKVAEAHQNYPDALVIAREGLPLSSHYAVHGIERGIPVMTTRVPEVGETIYPTKGRPPRLTRKQCISIRNEIEALLTAYNPFGDDWQAWEQVVPTALGTIHAQFQWGWKKHLLTLRAVALVALLKFTFGAGVGEMRHWWSRNGPGLDKDGEYIGNDPTWFPGTSHGKFDLYRHCICEEWKLADIEERLNIMADDFENDGWRRGYGGKAWSACARSGARLASALRVFLEAPSVNNWRVSFDRANVLVNTAHNGGKCLTKITHEAAFDGIAQAPALGFCNGYVGALLMGDLEQWKLAH